MPGRGEEGSEQDRMAGAAIRTVFGEFLSRRISAPVALARLLLHVDSPARLDGILGSQRLGPDVSFLEIGCGIGRIAQAFSPRVRHFHGLDISPKMLSAARRRCVDLQNVTFSLTSGRDLSSLADHSFDVVAAVDSFPYIH